MGTAIGVLIGIIATVLVSRYYFRRSTKKELSPYRLLESQIFAGIEPQVRRRLRFTFEDQEVEELSHLGLLIANTGERAISGFLEPPSITLPAGAKVLDATLEHRYPETLEASVIVDGDVASGQRVSFRLPLLNKGEYFVVRLLISGDVSLGKLRLRLLADDLPREIRFTFLPYYATRTRRAGVEWGAIGGGASLLALAFCSGYVLRLLHGYRPSLFLLPWSTFEPSFESIAAHVAVAITLLLGVLGAVVSIGAGLSEAFSRGPRFPLPDHIGRGYLYRGFEPPVELVEGREAARKEGPG